MNNFKLKISVFILLTLMGYSLLYYTYKFYSPDFGGTDFYFYYPLYKEFAISKTESPFNMRLISPFIVYLMNKTEVFYHTHIHYKNIDIEQKIFFNAILLNWLSVIITAYLIFVFLYNQYKNILLSFLSALLYTFSFGTILFCINPNTDGFSILLITITYILYKRQSPWMYIMYPLLLFQREFAFIIFGILALFDIFLAEKKHFYIIHFSLNLLFFITYYVLRKTLFFTPMYSNQITEQSFLHNLLHISLNINDFIKQAFLTQNLLILFIFIILVNGKNRWNFHKNNFYILIVFIILTFIISRIAVANNNMGRFLHMFSPILIIQMLYPELEFFLRKIIRN